MPTVSGRAVSGAGDVDRDGWPDVVAGAHGDSPNGPASGAAFAVVAAVSGSRTARAPLTEYAGLGSRSPFLAAALALFMLAMGGIPLTAGFVGKAAVFRAAIDADYLWLVITGLVAAVGGLFFYLRVIVLMYMQSAEEDAAVAPAGGIRVAVAIASVVTVAFGIVPWPLLDWVRDALPL